MLRQKEDGWVATTPDVISAEMDAAGFGKTPSDAVDDLLRNPRFQAWLTRTSNPQPSMGDFDIDDGHDEDGIIPEREGRHGNFPPFQDPGKR
jgi:hypothetical protein